MQPKHIQFPKQGTSLQNKISALDALFARAEALRQKEEAPRVTTELETTTTEAVQVLQKLQGVIKPQ